MIRLLLLMLGMVTTQRPTRRGAVQDRAGDGHGAEEMDPADRRTLPGRPTEPADGRSWPDEPGPMSSLGLRDTGADGGRPWVPSRPRGPRRRRIPRWVKWTTVLVVAGLIFRRAVASLVLIALSAALHLVGINVHLPKIKLAWPWQTITAGTTTNVALGPWVLQKIEGVSKPAFGQANFNFVFTRKVSKNIGFLPCWYSSTFYAVGHASATVNLNPGPAWWTPTTGHYRLQVLSRPQPGKAGQLAVSMVLPRPQLPQSAHDITIDNIPSKPLDVQHSWTYPGLACGVLIRPQFTESVLYAQAQQIAFYKADHSAAVTGPLVRAAETEATQTVRNNLIQPTVNALGYTLKQFTIHWATGS
jgi:hypothetical protein